MRYNRGDVVRIQTYCNVIDVTILEQMNCNGEAIKIYKAWDMNLDEELFITDTQILKLLHFGYCFD